MDSKDQGVDAVALDLRYNGGGSLSEAITLTGLFLYDGPIVQVKGPDGRVSGFPDPYAAIDWAGPLVVLTSKFSASASEIFAGAIQDYQRGWIVGDHSTHGKGTVQSLVQIGRSLFGFSAPAMGSLKLTMQQFYRPSGDSTQKRGVIADVELPLLSAHYDMGEADSDYPVAFDRVEPLRFRRFNEVSPPLVDQLRRLSEQRCAVSEKFQRVVRNIARYKEQKAKKYITLNETKFLKNGRTSIPTRKKKRRWTSSARRTPPRSSETSISTRSWRSRPITSTA